MKPKPASGIKERKRQKMFHSFRCTIIEKANSTEHICDWPSAWFLDLFWSQDLRHQLSSSSSLSDPHTDLLSSRTHPFRTINLLIASHYPDILRHMALPGTSVNTCFTLLRNDLALWGHEVHAMIESCNRWRNVRLLPFTISSLAIIIIIKMYVFR